MTMSKKDVEVSVNMMGYYCRRVIRDGFGIAYILRHAVVSVFY